MRREQLGLVAIVDTEFWRCQTPRFISDSLQRVDAILWASLHHIRDPTIANYVEGATENKLDSGFQPSGEGKMSSN